MIKRAYQRLKKGDEHLWRVRKVEGKFSICSHLRKRVLHRKVSVLAVHSQKEQKVRMTNKKQFGALGLGYGKVGRELTVQEPLWDIHLSWQYVLTSSFHILLLRYSHGVSNQWNIWYLLSSMFLLIVAITLLISMVHWPWQFYLLWACERKSCAPKPHVFVTFDNCLFKRVTF